mgnify:FL=1
MNIQQFQYILAVADKKHFEKAADKCFISQSTLSTMISKFEDEIGIMIFDRKKKPVELTAEGEIIVEQLKVIDKDIAHLKETVKEIKGEVKGRLSISVIPTIAPFLLPLFLQSFATKFPNLNIEVREQTTDEIIRQLKSRDLDIGILSIPVQEKDLLEVKLYDEPFAFYDAGSSPNEKGTINEIDKSSLCLLEEGHCMRNQVIELCDMHKKQSNTKLNFDYKAGSIDSLLRFVKANKAATLLPYLAAIELPEYESKALSFFSDPVPYRTVGIAVHRHFVKNKVLEMLKNEILEKVIPVFQELDIEGNRLSPI